MLKKYTEGNTEPLKDAEEYVDWNTEALKDFSEWQ